MDRTFRDQTATGKSMVSEVVDDFVVADEVDDQVTEEDVNLFEDIDENENGYRDCKAITLPPPEMTRERILQIDPMPTCKLQHPIRADNVRQYADVFANELRGNIFAPTSAARHAI